MANLEGAVLSDYLLLECISRGSVADVYRARQNEGQYEVAVKIFRPTYAEREDFRSYFLREAEKIGQFDHPHILPFLEYGEGEGLLYSVTPFVKSGTLDDLLKKVGGRFSAMQALPVVQQLCDAVQYAHDHDVIHGSIKPGNIFVANDGRMLLADFGIARGYADGQVALNKMEWGVTQYAAPEQSLGLLRRGGDIYSLGAVFFRVLTGSPVFIGQTPVEVLLKHVRQQPPLARSLEAGISDVVDAVLQKALSKRTDDRYQTAQELGRAFAVAVSFAPVASPVAREITMATRPLTFDLSPAVPVAVASLAMQATAPTMPVVPIHVTQAALVALPSALVQQSIPQSPVLPEQHGLTGSSFAITAPTQQLPLTPPEQVIADSSAYWSDEPVAWSPLTQTQLPPDVEDMPTRPDNPLYWQQEQISASKQKQQLEQENEPEPVRRQSHWLPVLVIILLLVGLLAALLSSFFLPAPAGPGAGWHVVPGGNSASVSLVFGV